MNIEKEDNVTKTWNVWKDIPSLSGKAFPIQMIYHRIMETNGTSNM